MARTGGVLPFRCLELPPGLPLPVSGRLDDSLPVALRQALPEHNESVYPSVRKPLKAPCFQWGLGQLQDVLISWLAMRTLRLLLRRNKTGRREEERSAVVSKQSL